VITQHKRPVLIVGGGPVGLALAVELGWRGIACTLIEQGDGTIVSPKMNEVNIRTMEFCRRWGIAKDVYECPFPPDYPLDVAFVTTLAGDELSRMRVPPRMSPPESHSPVRQQVCSQMWFDPILQRCARSFPHVDLRYRTRLGSFDTSNDGVVAHIVDLQSGRRERVEAEYLVGSDGANSMVRRALGIELAGHRVLDRSLNLFFRAPHLLKKCNKEAGTTFIAVDRHGLWAILRAIDPANAMWRLMVLDIESKDTPDSIDRQALLDRLVGRSMDVEWLGLSIWARRSGVAERYSQGRIFLAGDAVHQFSPSGGQGMNTGIGDAVDLGWKLAAVLDGWGGEHLLSSYDSERRPVGKRNVDLTTGFYLDHHKFADGLAAIEEGAPATCRWREQLGHSLVRDVGRMFSTAGLQLGYCYENSPICVPDGTLPGPDDPKEYIPSARPGSRAPHVWLNDGRSILDLFGHGFVLLRFGNDAPDGAAFESAATARGIPLKTAIVTTPKTAELYGHRLVLVRPDGHVAWRTDEVAPSPGKLMDYVCGVAAIGRYKAELKSRTAVI
jgi:2-polyprenyl-6-methoxyphenol hydroxylase-like FAD-dependent oxidoreductase